MTNMTDGRRSPQFTFDIGEHRHKIKKSAESKFKVKDRVYLLSQDGTSGEGPYLIESVPSQGMYTLCHEDDQRTAKNGDIIEEKDLVLADTKS